MSKACDNIMDKIAININEMLSSYTVNNVHEGVRGKMWKFACTSQEVSRIFLDVNSYVVKNLSKHV